jgi:transketolase
MHSVAAAAQVSVSTVSRVVAGHAEVSQRTRARVLSVIEELGYRPSSIARALVAGHSPTLGLLISDIANPFYPQLAKSVEHEARRHGFAVVVCNTEDDPHQTRDYAKMLKDLGVRGVIQASGGPDDRSLIRELGGHHRVVFTNRRPSLRGCSFVVSDNEAGAASLTRHLIEQGHSRIGFIAGPDYASNARERLAGFLTVMADLGDRGSALVAAGGFSFENGATAVRDWVADGVLPTAVIGVNDLVALGAVEALIDQGLTIPSDVAVAGFDDIELAGSNLLSLTSVRQHIDQMGAEAVRMLVTLMGRGADDAPIQVVVAPELAIRNSTSHRLDSPDTRKARDALTVGSRPVSVRDNLRRGSLESRPRGMSTERDPTAYLREMARRIRVECLRAVAHAGGGHLGGPLSAAEILAVLYFNEMRIRPDEPMWQERDRFVLSKGHSSIGLYSALALRGYFPLEELKTFDGIDSRLQGHPDMTKLPGVDMSTGSLGQGISAAVGLALGMRRRGWPSRVYVLLGDGECQEGEVWEAAYVAQRYNLENLVAIVDANGLGQYGPPAPSADERMSPWRDGELAVRWRACDWNVIEADGHDPRSLGAAFELARTIRRVPSLVLARTIKGKGVSFMENRWYWHSRVPTHEELNNALAELSEVV